MPQVCIHFECLSVVSSSVGGSVFFSHPTRSLFFLVFPPPLSQDTSVSDTSVSPGQVSLHTNICRCDIESPLRELFYIQAYFQVSRLCIAKPTAWKRGCGKVKSPPIPHCQKRALRCLPFSRKTWGRLA